MGLVCGVQAAVSEKWQCANYQGYNLGAIEKKTTFTSEISKNNHVINNTIIVSIHTLHGWIAPYIYTSAIIWL